MSYQSFDQIYGKTFVPTASRRSGALGGLVGDIWGAITGTASTALDVYGQQQQAIGAKNADGTLATPEQIAAAKAAAAASATPSWLLPVGIVAGVGVLALVLLMSKEKTAPKSNPHRRRRRRRSR